MTLDTRNSHPQISARLKRANGHLAKVIQMLDDQAPPADIAQQLFAVEKAIAIAKRVLIYDHIEHCLSPDGQSDSPDIESLKTITKYL
ncbi:metal-sensing transcriptional repressor [Ruegeria profundi]|uniref:Copper-sensing transcriptional repressor CsoR n=1 Tax=Ruegeria profundi TaxID=1685378 RepID=A0A0X3TPR6_9RHOB|nr:metal-sensing transcriptional repressor [Ruegeria profundi]KUJ77703.1 hypothetical protein AVO44_15330 [Ruegeria profundi]